MDEPEATALLYDCPLHRCPDTIGCLCLKRCGLLSHLRMLSWTDNVPLMPTCSDIMMELGWIEPAENFGSGWFRITDKGRKALS